MQPRYMSRVFVRIHNDGSLRKFGAHFGAELCLGVEHWKKIVQDAFFFNVVF